ncbi:MAG: diguanylate cyclase [Kiritimatiellae bacterium]|nr:diguanylate cyclase [Kiritimatiellia bacterium]
MSFSLQNIELTLLVAAVILLLLTIAFSLVKYERMLQGHGIDPQDHVRLSIARRLQVGGARGEFFLLWIRFQPTSTAAPEPGADQGYKQAILSKLRAGDEYFYIGDGDAAVLVDAPAEHAPRVAARIRTEWAARGWPALAMASASIPADGLHSDALLAAARSKVDHRTGDPAHASPAPSGRKSEEENLRPAELRLLDPATGVLQPAYAVPMARKYVARARRRDRSVVLVLVGIERWPELVETHGTAVAAQALKEAAQCIEHLTRESDLIGRADERSFFALCECPIESSEVIARRLCEALGNLSIGVGSARIHLVVNAGLSLLPDHTSRAGDLFWMADEARQSAAELGPNRWAVYKPGPRRTVRDRVDDAETEESETEERDIF